MVDGAILVSVAGAEYFEEGLASGVETVTVARFDADGTRRAWLNTVAVCESCLQDTSWWYQQQFRVNHGIVTMYAGAALDFATGAPVFGDEAIVARPVAADVLMVKTASGRQVPATLRAPDGTTLAIVGDAAPLVLQGDVPPHPLRAERGGSSLQVTAYDPANGQSRWPQPITVARVADAYSTAYVRFDGERLLFVTTREVVAVDPESGAVLWRKTIAGVDYLSSASAADQTIFLAVNFRTSTSMASRTYALDAHTGDVLWQVDGAASVAPAPGGGESLLVEGSGSSGQIARLDPADRPENTGVPIPADAPACPDAMTPISWVQYTDGAVLVCQQDGRFSVVVPNANWRAAELHFNDGGYSIVFTNGIRLTASLGGMLVSIDDRGTVTTPAVTRAWSSTRGEGPFTAPAGLPACPAGSWPLSLSTFSGGWLFVCGTATASPTSLVLYDDGQTIEGSEVTYRSGAYCAQTDGGAICAYWAPALVTREIGSGVVQHSVDHNYFAGRGSGGTGQGTGSYGVDTPTQDAQDQVRYLTQILQRSMVGRASLETAINQVRSCTNVADAVASLGDVVVNREELLDAVAAAPVDAVPNGAALVAKLRLALQRSLDTDRYWLAWAQAQAATNCSDGTSNPNYLRANEMTHGVADAKNDFLTTWNTQIAPRYRAPRFTIGQI